MRLLNSGKISQRTNIIHGLVRGKCTVLVFVIFFICFSLLNMQSVLITNITPQQDVFEEVSELGNDTRLISFKNSNGQDVFSVEKHCAQIIQRLDQNGFVVQELFYDLNGDPLIQPDGHYGVKREYNELGQNCCLTYLGVDGEPIMNYSGFATVTREFDNQNRITRESYFDKNGEPATLSLGQNAVSYDYISDLVIKVTYLNKSYSPIVNQAGYSYAIREIGENGTIIKETFYDEENNQVSLAQKQWGVVHKNGTTRYLNKSGKEFISIRLILQDYPDLIVVFGIIMCILFSLLPNKTHFIFLLGQLYLIIYMTMCQRAAWGSEIELNMFWSYKQFFTNYNLRLQILNNIWLFIPFGAGIRSLLRKPRYLIIPFLLSVSIEAAQFIFHLGLCELDDVFSNTLGGCIGFMMAYEIEEIITWLRLKRSCCHGNEVK